MSRSCIHRKECRLCHSRNVVLGVNFEATPPGDIYVTKDKLTQRQERFPLDLYLCENCGSVQLLDVVDPKILYGNYIYQTSVSLGLPEHFLTYVFEVLGITGSKPGGLVIDIGSNDGTLLRCFQQKGMKVLGVDPAPAAVKTANERGVETLLAFFNRSMGEKIRRERGAAAIVTANNVMANIDDLDDFVLGVRALIEPDGYFIFETGYGVDLFENKLVDVVYHEHISYFTIKPLEMFFRTNGMKMIDARHILTKGGSIRCIVQSEKSTRAPQPSVQKMISLEAQKKMDRIDVCHDMAEFIKKKRLELNEVLSRVREEGKSVVGYGASVGVTTLIYLFGLADKLAYLVDDNPARFGLFTPGHHLSVFSSQELYERKPGYVLILAWRYAEPITKRHEAYTCQGGKFISFLPELKIH